MLQNLPNEFVVFQLINSVTQVLAMQDLHHLKKNIVNKLKPAKENIYNNAKLNIWEWADSPYKLRIYSCSSIPSAQFTLYILLETALLRWANYTAFHSTLLRIDSW